MQLSVLTFSCLYLFNQQKSVYKIWHNFISEKLNQQYLLNSFPGIVCLLHKNTVVFSNQLYTQILNENQNLISNILRDETSSLLNSNISEKSIEVSLSLNHKLQEHLIMISKLLDQQFIIVGLNIQNQKEKEKQIKEQKALLDQSSKMAALGEMSGGIANEINNPLAVINLTTQMLRKDNTLSPD